MLNGITNFNRNMLVAMKVYQNVFTKVSICPLEMGLLFQVLKIRPVWYCSTNPALDLGQVEGAFVMGLGYWLTEECKYDPTTGALVTDSTWVLLSAILLAYFIITPHTNYVCGGGGYTVFTLSVRPWRFDFSLISWKGNNGNSSNFADTLISIRCTFIIEN